jgi:hypothetical protein
MHLGRKLLHTANDQLEFTLQCLCLGELLTLGFDMRKPTVSLSMVVYLSAADNCLAPKTE